MSAEELGYESSRRTNARMLEDTKHLRPMQPPRMVPLFEKEHLNTLSAMATTIRNASQDPADDSDHASHSLPAVAPPPVSARVTAPPPTAVIPSASYSPEAVWQTTTCLLGVLLVAVLVCRSTSSSTYRSSNKHPSKSVSWSSPLERLFRD